jgi:hypothetical protein
MTDWIRTRVALVSDMWESVAGGYSAVEHIIFAAYATVAVGLSETIMG